MGPCAPPLQVKYTVQTLSCRLAYRGRTANHAAKLAVAAAQGQVVCSSSVAEMLLVGDTARLRGIALHPQRLPRGILQTQEV